MITWALIASAVIALMLVVLVQGKWTNRIAGSQPPLPQPSWLWRSTTTSITSISNPQLLFPAPAPPPYKAAHGRA
jgi:hypothetical protein